MGSIAFSERRQRRRRQRRRQRRRRQRRQRRNDDWDNLLCRFDKIKIEKISHVNPLCRFREKSARLRKDPLKISCAMGLEVDCFKFDLKRKKSRSEMIPARKLVLFVRKLNKNVVVIIVNNDSNTLQGHFERRVEELKS